MKNLIAAIAVLTAFGLSAAPEVSDVSVTQKGRTVKISYELTGAPAIIMVDLLKDEVSIGAAALYNVADGAFAIPAGLGYVGTDGPKTIEVKLSRAYLDSTGARSVALKAKVKAVSAGLPPDYAAFDLHEGRAAYFEKLGDLPIAFGNDCWKKRYLLMRRIPAACVRWRMGGNTSEWSNATDELQHYVTLTHDYYMSVYELTNYQSSYVDSGATSGSMVPARGTAVSYDYFRGTVKNWPADLHEVSEDSWLDKLRKKFGSVYAFDLPTEAQWEFAARGGEYAAPRWDMTLTWQQVGYGGNKSSPTTVGTLAENPYGLYDVYGNVWEYCLDHQAKGSKHLPDEVVDPVGNADAAVSTIVIKGGGHWDDGSFQFRGGRRLLVGRDSGNYYGARLTLNIE